MEKDLVAGKVGSVKISLEKGKAKIELIASESALDGAAVVQASASASIDALALVDMLMAEIEAKSPAGAAAIEEAVKVMIKQAVLAIQ